MPSAAACRIASIPRPGRPGCWRPRPARPRREPWRRRRDGHRGATSAERPRRSRRAHRHGAGSRPARAPVRSASGGGAQRAGRGGEPLTGDDHRAGRAGRDGCPESSRGERGSLGAGRSLQQRALELVEAARCERGHRVHLGLAEAGALAQPQEDDRRLLLGLEAYEQDGRRLLQRLVADVLRRDTGDRRAEEREFLRAHRTRPEVDAVRGQCDAGELRVRVGVLLGEPPTGQDADVAALARLAQSGRGALECVPANWRRHEGAVGVTHQRDESAGRTARRTGTPSGPCRSSTPR